MSGVLNVLLARKAATAVETFIAAATGTAITSGSGAANVFDGVTSGAAVTGTGDTGGAVTVSRVGKDFGSGVTKVISGYKDYGSSDGGYGNLAAAASITHTLKASNTDPTTSSWAGTTIGSTTAGNAWPGATTQSLGNSNSTGYRYVWIELTHSSARSLWIAELELYEWI